jgi:hypothetical protein
MRVSHETIYRSLFIQARGVLKKELMDHLRSKRRMRRLSSSVPFAPFEVVWVLAGIGYWKRFFPEACAMHCR